MPTKSLTKAERAAMRTLGSNIREARTIAGLSVDQLATHLERTPRTISAWERGEYAPNVYAIRELAKTLGVTTDMLFGLTDPPVNIVNFRTNSVTITSVRTDTEWFPINDFFSGNALPYKGKALVRMTGFNNDPSAYFAVRPEIGDNVRFGHLKQLQNGWQLIPDTPDTTCRTVVYDVDEYPNFTVLGDVIFATNDLDYE